MSIDVSAAMGKTAATNAIQHAMRLPSDFHMISSPITWPKIENDTSCWGNVNLVGTQLLAGNFHTIQTESRTRKLSEAAEADADADAAHLMSPSLAFDRKSTCPTASTSLNLCKIMQPGVLIVVVCQARTARNCNVDLVYGRATCKGQ